MQAKTFFRVAVLLPLFALLAIWFWEPRIWQHGHGAVPDSLGMQAMDFVRSWLLMGGGQYMLSAAAVLCAMERMRHRSQISQMQLLFALSPAIFFLVCCAFSLFGIWLVPMLGEDTRDMETGGFFLALSTLTLGTIYVFIMSVAFVVLRRCQLVRDPRRTRVRTNLLAETARRATG